MVEALVSELVFEEKAQRFGSNAGGNIRGLEQIRNPSAAVLFSMLAQNIADLRKRYAAKLERWYQETQLAPVSCEDGEEL